MKDKIHPFKSSGLAARLTASPSSYALPPLAPEHKTVSSLHKEAIEVGLLSFQTVTLSESYETLCEEVAFLSCVHAQSFLFLAQRLKKIRDQKLYRHGGYSSFKAFVEAELPIARTMAYNYIKLWESLNNCAVQSIEQLSGYKPTALVKALPYLKKYPLKQEEILIKAQTLSVRELESELEKVYPLKLRVKNTLLKTPFKENLEHLEDSQLNALLQGIISLKRQREPQRVLWERMESLLSFLP